MAGDWIKMRVDLIDDPAVITLAEKLHLSEDEVIGKLYRLWSWADRHSIDGTAPNITSSWVDRYVMSGFAQAMVDVGWLMFNEHGITFPRFNKHNGSSAKKRCDNAIRQRLSRIMRDKHVTGCKRTSIPKPFLSHVYKRDNYTCVYCGVKSSSEKEGSYKSILSIDHIIPASRGGETKVDNLVSCCKLCNQEKNDRTPEEWDVTPTFLTEGVTYQSQKICDNRVTREEKRRDINNTPTPFITIDELVEKWNQLSGVRTVLAINETRKRKFKARSKESFFRENYQAALDKFPLQCFADGEWLPDLDWFLRPDKVQEIIEGKCDWSKDNHIPKSVQSNETFNFIN